MRIRDIFKNLINENLNEAGDPGDNAAAKLTRKKATPQGSDTRADGKLRKVAAKPGPVKDQVVGGKGIGNAGGQIKKAVQAADRKRDAAGEEAANSTKKGTLNPLSVSSTDSTASAAADKWASSVGTQGLGRNRLDQTKDTNRPKFNNDVKDNQAHGLDDAQKDPQPFKFGNREFRWIPQAKIDQTRATGDAHDAQIADAMVKNNADYEDAKQKKKEEDAKFREGPRAAASGRDKFSEDEEEMGYEAIGLVKNAKAKGMDGEKIRSLLMKHFGLQSEEEMGRLTLTMRHCADKIKKGHNAEFKDSTSDEEIEMGRTTGAARGRLEVADMVRKSNESGVANMSPEEVNELAVRGQQGDQEAIEMIFQKMARMLYGAASRYSFGSKEQLADMYAEAKIAMMEAIKHFDSSKGASFSTFLFNTVKNLVKNAAYENRAVRLPQKEADKVAHLKRVTQQVRSDGFDGADADLEIIARMGLKTWAEYDKLKQQAQSTASMNHSTGEEGAGEFGDTLGSGDVAQGEYSSSEDQAIGTGASPEDDLQAMQKELATKDPTMSTELMTALYDRAGIDEQTAEIVNDLFGIGGKAPMSDSDIKAIYGLTTRSLEKFISSTVLKMGTAIADINQTDPESEADNLMNILNSRKSDFAMAQAGRSYDPSEDRTPEQKAEDELLASRRDVLKHRRAKGNKE